VVQRIREAHPLVVLGVGGALVVALEAGRTVTATPAYRWLLVEGVVAAVALFLAWENQERLRLPGLLVLAVAFHGALVGVHRAAGLAGDSDPVLYVWQGEMLLDGDYPHSEYPTGAVLLFGLEAALTDGSGRTVNALAMIPFQLLTVAAIWACRTRWSPWLAALVAFWPFNVYFWEFRYDLLPTALLAWGLVLALRERFVPAGLVLGVGAAVKWTPALAVLALVVWLIASRRPREAAAHALSAACVFAVFTLPFLVWSPNDVLAAYSTQGGRTIIAESLPYLPLHWLGLAEYWEGIPHQARVGAWANDVASAVQIVLVAGTLAVAALARGRLRSGVAVAALVPVVFLVTNRIFSAQFMVVLLAAWAVAIALLAQSRREQLVLAAAAAAASAANAFVFPFGFPITWLTWQICSTVMFALALGVTGWLLRAAAVESSPEPIREGRAPRASARAADRSAAVRSAYGSPRRDPRGS
jgi:Glycosyltransferase family 87